MGHCRDAALPSRSCHECLNSIMLDEVVEILNPFELPSGCSYLNHSEICNPLGSNK